MENKKINNLTKDKIDGSKVKGGFGFRKIFGLFKNRENNANPPELPSNDVHAGLPPQNGSPTSPPDVSIDSNGRGVSSFNPNAHQD